MESWFVANTNIYWLKSIVYIFRDDVCSVTTVDCKFLSLVLKMSYQYYKVNVLQFEILHWPLVVCKYSL